MYEIKLRTKISALFWPQSSSGPSLPRRSTKHERGFAWKRCSLGAVPKLGRRVHVCGGLRFYTAVSSSCRLQTIKSGQIYDSMRSQAGLRKSMFKAQAHCRRLQLCSRHILTYLLYQARKRLVFYFIFFIYRIPQQGLNPGRVYCAWVTFREK